jgi:hypothetical protein
MVTTDNVPDQKPTSGSKASIGRDDAKLMTDDYTNGKSVSDISQEYGYSEAEVTAIVVKEAKE